MTWSQRTRGRREITFKTFTPGARLPVQAQLAALTVSALLKGITTVVMKRRGTVLMRVNSYQRSTVTQRRNRKGEWLLQQVGECVCVCVWACVYCLQFTQQHTGRASKPCCFLLWGKHNPQPWGRARTNSGAPGGRPSSMIPWRRSRPPGGRLLDPENSSVTNSLYTYLYTWWNRCLQMQHRPDYVCQTRLWRPFSCKSKKRNQTTLILICAWIRWKSDLYNVTWMLKTSVWLCLTCWIIVVRY